MPEPGPGRAGIGSDRRNPFPGAPIAPVRSARPRPVERWRGAGHGCVPRCPHGDAVPETLELARSTDDEKQSQLKRLAEFHAKHASAAPAALAKLKQTAINGGNVFAELMEAVKVCSLGQITDALFEVGGQYRRSM